MATVKILYDSDASHLEEYLKRNQEKDMLTTERSCELNGVANEFNGIQRNHGSKGNNSIHLIQSWSPKESKILSKEQVHTMGVELASRFAPGHQFVVQTHDDQPHFHNHIMINPVSIETGKRIQNKLGNIPKVRKLNDEIAREHGMSVLPAQEKLTRPGPNERAKRIEAYRGRSYILDLSRKARFASGHATNYDEYLSILNAFDIQARIEPKNITYFYPNRKFGKRGRNLDPDLDKPALEKVFAANHKRITEKPELRQGLSEILKQAPSEQSTRRVAQMVPPLVSHRKEETYTAPRPAILAQSLIPIEAFQAAKGKSILEYCERNKIPTEQMQNGRTVVKGREALEVSDHSWTNHKNKTRGNVIDFVAHHQRSSLLCAVSILTENPRLMLLEQYGGDESSRYRPFTIPEQGAASRSESVLALSRLLERPTARDGFADLFRTQRVSVGTNAVIRFFSERNDGQYAEFIPSSSGSYRQNVTGANGTFYSNIRGAKNIELFLEPKSLLTHRPDALSQNKPSSNGILALLEPSMEAVHRAIAPNRNVEHVTLIGVPDPEASSSLDGFFQELKESLNPFSIDVTLAWAPVSRSVAPEIDLARSRNIEIFQRR